MLLHPTYTANKLTWLRDDPRVIDVATRFLRHGRLPLHPHGAAAHHRCFITAIDMCVVKQMQRREEKGGAKSLSRSLGCRRT